MSYRNKLLNHLSHEKARLMRENENGLQDIREDEEDIRLHNQMIACRLDEIRQIEELEGFIGGL